MAWIFSLSIECGENQADADCLAAYFTFSAVCSDGVEFPCKCWVSKINGDGWWCIVCPQGVSTSGITSEKDQRLMDELAQIFYQRLRGAPPYRFAIVAVEAEGFRSYEELDDDVVQLNFSGLVLSEAVWRHLKAPSIFVPFEPGYVWRPFIKTT